ncbi:hypothetical protein BDN67DRAFT_148117 [Paxillus ammoniavirescens]|nr:hypothetical protein BDN67DRAFT_148117 [Paxillus ammoniavirescens]
MSSVPTSGNYSAPRHKLHDPSQPLPGLDAPGAAQTEGYPPESIERLPGSDESDPACPTKQRTGHIDSEDLTASQLGKGQCADGPRDSAAQHRGQGQRGHGHVGHGQSAFNADRPLDVAPTPEGGVAIGGGAGLPEGRAGLGDKVVGKTQKVIGKYTNKPEMHEKGELRETGGKAAADGLARAAHD